MAKPRSSSTLPARTSSFAVGSSSRTGTKQLPAAMGSKLNGHSSDHLEFKADFLNAPIYSRMQSIVQQMLHSEHGVPIKSHKRRIISAIPSAFTGADMVNWIYKNLSMESKAEAVHLANLLCRHGFFFCIEGVGTAVKDDGSLFRFQTPYYWPSQNPDVSDFAYGVYLVKQVLRSKHRIRLLDYELNNLHKLKLRLAKEWKTITAKADEDVKVFREQKRVAKAIMSSQEEAFWRLYRPPPGETSVQDSALTRHGTERAPREAQGMTMESLLEELEFLKRSSKVTRCKVSTAVENLSNFCGKYREFDPMLNPAYAAINPWITGDNTLWTLDKSLIEYPSERHVKKWVCSFYDLLNDVTGRFKFEQYCKSQFNLENIRFYQACVDLKSIPLAAVSGSVQLIYDEFLERGAVSEVNVSAKVQAEAEKDLKDPSRYSFSGAMEEIYKLMQNDIYPRFLNSQEYQQLLRKGKEMDEAGKGFFAKLQRKKFDVVRQDASGISPCLPQRYTRRQLSISRKMSAVGVSSSMDNIFITSSSPNAATPFGVETKRNSAYTEAFIDSLMSPGPSKMTGAEATFRQRRVSAPDTPVHDRPMRLRESAPSPLTHINEVHHIPPPLPLESPLVADSSNYAPGLGMEVGMPMSYSADDLQQLIEDADDIGPSKWKKFGIAAGIEFTDGAAAMTGFDSPLRSKSDNTHDHLSSTEPDLLAMPILSGSPRYGRRPYEFESLEPADRDDLTASSGSIHSTCSH